MEEAGDLVALRGQERHRLRADSAGAEAAAVDAVTSASWKWKPEGLEAEGCTSEEGTGPA